MSENAAKSRIFVLIPCAGQGVRAGLPETHAVAGRPKQYQAIAGTPMIIHTVEAFRALGSALAGVWLVIAPDDRDFEDVFPGFNAEGEQLLRVGGETRAASVQNGLQALLASPGAADANDWVLVHDAARCLITPEQIQALISSCRGDAVGGLLAQPLADTLKVEQAEQAALLEAGAARVNTTLDRAGKWLAQTPQMFRIGALLQALEQAAQNGSTVTDESSAMEALGLSPKLVRGSALNLKITYPEDFALAEAILVSRQG
jgi:2-C-methyl-D-erythritol 4-phosphate cytidylyltransferase